MEISDLGTARTSTSVHLPGTLKHPRPSEKATSTGQGWKECRPIQLMEHNCEKKKLRWSASSPRSPSPTTTTSPAFRHEIHPSSPHLVIESAKFHQSCCLAQTLPPVLGTSPVTFRLRHGSLHPRHIDTNRLDRTPQKQRRSDPRWHET